MNARNLALILLISLIILHSAITLNNVLPVPEEKCASPEPSDFCQLDSETEAKPSGDSMDTPSMPS